MSNKNNRNKKTNSQKYNNPKGKLLEKVVAILYQTPGAQIQTNVQYPTTDGKRSRQIDILWTTHIAGFKVEYAFQCKNEAEPIGEGKLSQFFGDLNDIGIPSKYGVFVTVNGFTKDAQEFANKYEIKTLAFKGLTDDRLRSELSSAIQHNIYLIPRIEQISAMNEASEEEFDYQSFIFLDKNKKLAGTIIDLVFNKWRNGEISEKLGNQQIEMEVPINWFQFYKGNSLTPMKVTAKFSIIAVVIKINGTAENHILFDTNTRKIERHRAHVEFQGFKVGDKVPLTYIYSEKELTEFLKGSDNIHLTIKTRLPRIISSNTFYPVSRTVSEKVSNLLNERRQNSINTSQEEFEEIVTEASENDLFREGLYNFWGKVVSVVVTDNEGDLVDLTLIAENGDFDKVISLKDKYIEAPSDSFKSMLAWAYEEKSQQLLKKALQSKTNHNTLLKKSLEFIENTLQLEPLSFSALELKAKLLIMLENYDEALNTIDFALSKDNQNIKLLLHRAFTLIRLKDWGSASKQIKALKRIQTNLNESNLKLYQSEILHGQNKYKKAWYLVFESWTNSPEQIIQYFSGTVFIDDLICKVITIESRWFHIELLFYRATDFLKVHEYETANKLFDYAVELLDDIKLANQMVKEPIAIGEATPEFIESNLLRIIKLLKRITNQTITRNYTAKISNWFERTYNEKPVFLNENQSI